MKKPASKGLVATLECNAATLHLHLRRLTALSTLIALAACGGADKATPVQAGSATPGSKTYGAAAPPASAPQAAVAAAMVVNGAQIATENKPFSFSGTKSVMYGADGKYLVANVTNQGTCSNAFFGSDPAPGLAKACYADLGWPQIATENRPLDFTGESVLYGANGKYHLATLTSPGTCSNTFFGGDPAPDTIKACYADLGWPQIATEGRSLSFTGSKTVMYGANGKFVLVTVSSQGTCSNAFFGSDPAPGYAKACYADVSGTQVATENNSFSVSGTKTVMYGANGKFVLATVTGQGTCSTAFFGTDPAPGAIKSCYVVDEAGAVQPPATGTPSTARIARIDVAQSHVFPSNDSALVLVSGKPALVRVNATTNNTSETKPTATLQVETSTGQLVQSIGMSVPANALPAAVPDALSATNAYTAVIPAALVTPGLRLTATLSNGQTSTINPRVGGGVAITLLAIPVQIGGTVGQIASGIGSYVQARMPTASVTVQNRATYVSKTVTALPANESDWNRVFDNVLGELYDLHMLEGASNRTFYYGFIPKRSYGLAGMGYQPGPAAVGYDMPSNLPSARAVLGHELGHNFSLPHAPCGDVSGADPQYPYANGQLGAAGRYIWGYDATTGAYIDARRTDLHDMMSYCGGDSFSDYNYRKIQVYLTPADKVVVAAASSAEAAGPQELLMVSGRINGDKIELTPLKSLRGEPRLPEGKSYTLRIVSAKGTVDYPFSPRELDHSQATQHFGFTIPHPGAIYSISVLKDGTALLQSVAAKAASERLASLAKPQVQAIEQDGVLRLTWDAASHKYLTVTHVGEKRTTLAQDLQGGTATLSSAKLPTGGSFEFSLSDGLNSVRIETAR